MIIDIKKTLQPIVLTALMLTGSYARSQAYEDFLRAVERGDVQAVGQYLAKGLDPNTADQVGNTALMVAARLGHEELVRFLVERKADVRRRSPFGDSALMFAALKGHARVVEFLVSNGAEVNNPGWTALHYAAFEGREAVARFLLSKGADREAVAPNGYTPLLLAALGGHVEAAKALLEEDADFRFRGPAGETALGLATQKRVGALELLLRRAGAVE